jgi:predicted deacylase
MKLAQAFGLDYAFYDDATSQVDTGSGPTLTTFEGSWVTAANKAGVPAICSEAGCDGRYEESDIAIHVRGLKNIMEHLGMIPGTTERKFERDRTIYFRSIVTITTEYTGIFYSLVTVGQDLSLDQPVAIIKDLKGDEIGRVSSPTAGVVLTILTKRFVNTADSLFYIMTIEKRTG